MPEQTFWRHCSECHMLFWDGYPHDKGVCSNGRGHLADGLIFALSYGVGQTANSQDSWYCCKKCKVMFYRGYGDNGKCFKGGGHEADWINFTLPFSISASNSSQDKWRFCNKCRVMFYEGYTLKNCADGGIHEARGQIFTLPHEGFGTPAVNIKWMGIPLPMLATVALDEFATSFKAGAKGQIPDDWILNLDAKIRSDPNGFKQGYVIGVLSGLVTGLKDLLKAMVKLLGEAVSALPPVMLFKAQREILFLLTDPAHVELRKAQLREAKRIAEAAKATIDDINHNPDDYIVLSKEVGEVMGKFAGRWFTQDFLQQSATKIGEIVGEILGLILLEIIIQIVLECITAGLGNIARAEIALGQGVGGGSRILGMVEKLKPLLQRTKGLKRFIELLIKDERGMLMIGKLKLPSFIRHPDFAPIAFETRLVEIAREVRVAKAGVTEEKFREINVAVAKIKTWASEADKVKGIPPKIEYIHSPNLPGQLQHSEGLILDQIQAIKKGGQRHVSIEQWYSERIPCETCLSAIKLNMKGSGTDAGVFFTVRDVPNRGQLLMKAYGL